MWFLKRARQAASPVSIGTCCRSWLTRYWIASSPYLNERRFSVWKMWKFRRWYIFSLNLKISFIMSGECPFRYLQTSIIREFIHRWWNVIRCASSNKKEWENSETFRIILKDLSWTAFIFSVGFSEQNIQMQGFPLWGRHPKNVFENLPHQNRCPSMWRLPPTPLPPPPPTHTHTHTYTHLKIKPPIWKTTNPLPLKSEAPFQEIISRKKILYYLINHTIGYNWHCTVNGVIL